MNENSIKRSKHHFEVVICFKHNMKRGFMWTLHYIFYDINCKAKFTKQFHLLFLWIYYLLKKLLVRRARREINEFSILCSSHTEIFSKRRKIYPICVKNLSDKKLQYQIALDQFLLIILLQKTQTNATPFKCEKYLDSFYIIAIDPKTFVRQ